MLFRALFCIGVVALLLPRAGQGGLGSGTAGIRAASTAGDLRDVLLDRLAAVKADIEQAERGRAAASR